MNGRSVSIVISPWASIEADCLRHLLRDLNLLTSDCIREDTAAFVQLVPRKRSPWPIKIPDELAQRNIPVVLVVDSIVPWSIALSRSLGAICLASWSDSPEPVVSDVKKAVAGRWTRAPRQTLIPRDPLTRLTAREREVISLVTQGQQDELIAARLGISVSTVRSHVQHCLTKLDVTHRHAAATVVRNSQSVASEQGRVVVPKARTEFR